ncbi:MAG: hypothetical protein R3362_08845 [Rhodothermales bacterium]|nr:hypothetical protein [Rhodothermales bacterium]
MPFLRIRPLLFALVGVLAFSLAACGEETDVEPDEDDLVVAEPEIDEPMEPAAPAVDVQGTINALQGGLTAVPMQAALDNINGWIARLDGAEFDGAEEIADNLEELREELMESEIDGDDVGGLLVELGEQTTAAAVAAGSAELGQLGGLLTNAGQGLTGGM